MICNELLPIVLAPWSPNSFLQCLIIPIFILNSTFWPYNPLTDYLLNPTHRGQYPIYTGVFTYCIITFSKSHTNILLTQATSFCYIHKLQPITTDRNGNPLMWTPLIVLVRGQSSFNVRNYWINYERCLDFTWVVLRFCQMYVVKNTTNYINIIYYELSAPTGKLRCVFIGEVCIEKLLVESIIYYLIILNNYENSYISNITLPTSGKICACAL